MTEPTSIPQLDLFHSRRARFQSMNDHINIRSDQIKGAYGPSMGYQRYSPYETERPFLQPPIYMPESNYVKAPSTFLQKTEDYLATGKVYRNDRPAEKTTARFLATNNYDFGSTKCDCQIGNQVTRDAYTKKSQANKTMKNFKSPVNDKNMPSKSVYQKNLQTPSKSPYMQLQTEREEPKVNPPQIIQPKPQKAQQNKSPNIFGMLLNPSQIPENQSVMEPSKLIKKEPQKKVVSRQTQTGQSQTINKSSVLISQLMRKIPNMLDDQSFRKLVKQQTQEFNNIKIEFEEESLAIDFDDLVQTKQQYMQFSRDLLLRLNHLAGDKKEMFLVGKLFEEKKKKGILWPQV